MGVNKLLLGIDATIYRILSQGLLFFGKRDMEEEREENIYYYYYYYYEKKKKKETK